MSATVSAEVLTGVDWDTLGDGAPGVDWARFTRSAATYCTWAHRVRGIPATFNGYSTHFRSSYRGESEYDVRRAGRNVATVRNLVDDSYAPGHAGDYVVYVHDGPGPAAHFYGATAVDALRAAVSAGAL